MPNSFLKFNDGDNKKRYVAQVNTQTQRFGMQKSEEITATPSDSMGEREGEVSTEKARLHGDSVGEGARFHGATPWAREGEVSPEKARLHGDSIGGFMAPQHNNKEGES
jgi:hypothetical protein